MHQRAQAEVQVGAQAAVQEGAEAAVRGCPAHLRKVGTTLKGPRRETEHRTLHADYKPSLEH